MNVNMNEAVPIPLALASRPTSGGLVVPFAVGFDEHGIAQFGRLGADGARCIREKLCQICGQPLGSPMVFLLRQMDRDRGNISSEPAMHSFCSAYSLKACPMLSGRLDAYRSRGRGVDPESTRAGQPADTWFALWCRDYRWQVNWELMCADLFPVDVLKVVPIQQ